MKLTENPSDDKVEIVEERQQEKEIRLIGRQRKIRGLILWEFNRKTLELNQAKFRKQDFQITSLTPSPSELSISNKVQVNEHCIYFQALNRKNALKKLSKAKAQ